MNNLIGAAAQLPELLPTQIISIDPISLDCPSRGQPLELRVTVPTNGANLPIILFSHGHGPSLYLPSKNGYSPLANYYASQGFAVIQPTHANSKISGLPHDRKGAPLFWKDRVYELTQVLDELDLIESSTPLLSGRFDHSRVAAVGHSMGGQTVGMLLGARLTDPNDTDAQNVSVIDQRIKVGVLLAPPGNGGDNLSSFAKEHYSELNPDYGHLKIQSLVVVGDSDINPFITVRGPEWYRAAFEEGPGASSLLTLIGGQHGLGGIAGYDAKETNDEDPDRLVVVQRMTTAFLRSALYKHNTAWKDACSALSTHAASLAHVEKKNDPPHQ